MGKPYTPERLPLTIDVHDDEEVRRWLALMVTDQVVKRREPIPAIHLLKDDHQEVLDWTRVLEADPGADLGATWAAVAARRDVERRILVLRLLHPDGRAEACMYEETHPSVRRRRGCGCRPTRSGRTPAWRPPRWR